MFIYACLFIYLGLFIYFERETAGEGQRERERESQAGSVLSAWSPMQGSNPQTVRS